MSWETVLYVHRPLEWGSDAADRAETPDESAYDVVTDDSVELAARLDGSPIIRCK